MRLIRLQAQSLALVRLVVREVAVEPRHLTVALEGEDVRRDAIEEPAIVADDDGAAREFFQRFFHRPQRVDVQVVGRFVQQDHVRAFFQHLRQMHAIALAAGQRAHLLRLIRAEEVETRHVGARVHFARAQRHRVFAAGDFPPHVVVGIECVAALIDVAQSAPSRRS